MARFLKKNAGNSGEKIKNIFLGKDETCFSKLITKSLKDVKIITSPTKILKIILRWGQFEAVLRMKHFVSDLKTFSLDQN